MNREVFENYLNKRFQSASALTPEQRLEVIETLISECRNSGLVPIDHEHLARLNPNDPAVQAVLRGEEVIVAGKKIRPEKGFSVSVGNIQDLKNASPTTRLLFTVGVGLVPILIGLYIIFTAFTTKEESVPLPTATPTSTPSVVTFQQEQTPTPERSVYFDGTGNQDTNQMDVPVSLEIGNVHVLVRQSSFGANVYTGSGENTWYPQQAEWLSGTQIRKVIAVPDDVIPEVLRAVGQTITLRYKTGYTVTFTITNVLRVTIDQIEIFQGSTPSLVLVLYNKDTTWRTVLLAQQSDLVAQSNTIQVTPTLVYKQAVVVSQVRMRKDASINSEVIRTLEVGETLKVLPVSPVYQNEHYWVNVQDEKGDTGWVALKFIKIQE
ncbi:SH3 domain-containing protein [Anaerolinea sp.]|uniref:SH3 domain-containing protein n=1 Tax=Anaerolinea sp. TaxID=1872519 RepID=UPI002ACDC4F8|nr:SH3 domain-containing protein [Anaerolinea sp.]